MADDLQSKAADMMKKVLTLGVGTIFLTEESLRGMVNDFKLPKELIGGILDSAAKTKDEFLKNLSKDVMSKISDKLDPKALIDEFFARNDIDIHMKVSFSSKAGGKPAVKVTDADEEDFP